MGSASAESRGLRLGALALLAAAGGWLATRSLQQDFAAYYTAAAAVRQKLDPYVNHLAAAGGPWDGVALYRHSRFLYPPLVAELLRPLAILPFAWAKVAFTAASVAALCWGLALVQKTRPSVIEVAGGAIARWRPLLVATWLPVLIALERGQIDLIVLCGLALAWQVRNRAALAGGLLALLALFKPAVLGVVPLLMCAHRWRWATATMAALGALACLTVAVSGVELSKKYWRDVLPRAAAFGEGGPEELLLTPGELGQIDPYADDRLAHVDGVGRGWVPEIGNFPRNISIPRLLAAERAPSLLACLLVYLILAVPLAIGARTAPEQPVWYWAGALAGALAAPVAWAMELVWAIPILCLAADATRPNRLGAWLLAFTFCAALLGPICRLAWVAAGLAAIAAAVVATIGLKKPAV